MTYNETIDYLYNAAPAFTKVGAAAYKEGLSNTLALDEHAGHPHHSFLTVHVAGTNGKGSCSHSIAAILQSAKTIVNGVERPLRVGLFTSPHLVTFRERIRVNGEMISEEYVVNWVERNRDFFEPLQPSFFELSTAMAFEYFRDQNVDIAVMEVGLGGRLDCTNIISPILSVITNISFDHTQFLGNTLASIAGEKAGIIKPNVPVVIGETTPETRSVFYQKAVSLNAPIIFAEEHPVYLDCNYELRGSYQIKNQQTVLNCLLPLARQLRKHNIYFTDATNSVKYALENVCKLTGLSGRWQTLSTSPLVICDTGHNVSGWEYLSKQIRDTASQQAQKAQAQEKQQVQEPRQVQEIQQVQAIQNKSNHERAKTASSTLRIVFGMVDDKDINTVMEMLPDFATYYFTQASTHRAIPVDKISTYAASHNLHGTCFSNVYDAYKAAIADASPYDFIFIGGSSYVVADLLTALQ